MVWGLVCLNDTVNFEPLPEFWLQLIGGFAAFPRRYRRILGTIGFSPDALW
jgi:hypothetical protein